MVSKRLSREAGHRRKFLAVIDDTPECERAVAYASRRAKNTAGSLVMLYVVDNSEFQQILGVGEIMEQEARDRAIAILEKFAATVREQQGIEPELIIREGRTSEELTNLIEEDQDIAILVLAAGSGKEGPGPLVQSLASRSQFTIPVTVIPAGLPDDDIDAVT